MHTPTDEEVTVMRAVHEHARAHNVAPTMDELARRLGLDGTNSLGYTVRRMVARGWMELAGKRRAVRLTHRGLMVLAASQRATAEVA